jgi:hypothetical protein
VPKKPLPVAGDEPAALGLSTVMDPALAARHGIAYVHLAVLAIDLDRAREGIEIDPAATEWPFGWEVFLTERYLLDHVDPVAARTLLEDVCLGIVETRSREHKLGSQIAFAVHDLVRRGRFPAELGEPFRSWRSAPRDLVASLDRLFEEEDARARELATSCLELPIEPPFAPPTVAALEKLLA